MLRSERMQATCGQGGIAHASEIPDRSMSNGSCVSSSSSASSRVSVSSRGLSGESGFRSLVAGKWVKLDCHACTDVVTILGTGMLVDILALRRDDKGEWADIGFWAGAGLWRATHA